MLLSVEKRCLGLQILGYKMLKVSFFSNYLNEHQLALCQSLASSPGVEFVFVALSKNGGNAGRSNLNDVYPFVLREYEGAEQANSAMRHAEGDDVVIFGHMSNKEQYVERRLSKDKLSFRATERILKRGLWWRFVPPKIARTRKWFLQYKSKPLYILCVSAYASYDLFLMGWPSSRCYKWGYFPEAKDSAGSNSVCSDKVSLVWAARMMEWKRPLAPLRLAYDLKRAGYDFHLHMAGDGPLMDEVRSYIDKNDLGDVVTLYGLLSGDDTRALMRDGDIYLATSSRKEGWGITVNEAMASGCAVIASASVGSAPFLIRDGDNGLLYDDSCDDDLRRQVIRLLDDASLVRHLSENAMRTIQEEWSASVACNRFLLLSQSLLHGEPIEFEDGPCSHADVLVEDWYRRKKNKEGYD